MATYQVEVTGKKLQRASIDKLVTALHEKFDGAVVTVKTIKDLKSRNDRFQDAVARFSEARSDIEGLRDELQEWRDGLPENLQAGSKADEIDEAVSALEDVISHLEEAEGSDVSFPGMY